MAEVYLATETHPDGRERVVVVKRVLENLADAEDFLALFEDEGRLAMKLVHPNIVRVLAVGQGGGLPFIAMEHLEGCDLRQMLAHAGRAGMRLQPGLACAIAARVARGLQYAHTLRNEGGEELGVVHRDVSPHNVFATLDGEVKLLDFGVAKSALQLTATRTGLIKGKLSYMAPEQLGGLQVDARADLFSLGVVLWEMLTGASLWKRDSETATARAVRDESAFPPSMKAPGISPEIDALVSAMLAKFPVSRPRSAADAAERLERLASSFGLSDPREEIARAVSRVLAASR